MKKFIPILILVVGGLVAYFVLNNNSTNDISPSNLSLNSDERMKGNPTAKVTVIEYIDLQCPSCSYVQNFWVKVWRIVEPDIHMVVRHYPLPGHPHAREAAVFTEAANEQGKFWEMHDILLEKQAEWSPLGSAQVKNKFFEYAEIYHLDIDQLKQDLKDKRDKFVGKIEKDIESGNAVGISGTPSIFINNQKIKIPSNPKAFLDTLKNYIDQSN